MKNNKHDAYSKAGAIAAGIAGLTAAAVWAYYLYGHEDAKKNRTKVKSWMLKAKGEILEDLEKFEGVTEPLYMQAVAAAARKYSQFKNIDQDELADFMHEMKGHWSGIKNTLNTKGAAVKKSVQAVKTAPKAKKKTARKAK